MKFTNTSALVVITATFLSACSMLQSKPDVDDQLIPQTEIVVPEIRMIFEQGDTLWEFAERTTGSGFNWEQIKTANLIEDENNIDAGIELIVPFELALESLKNR